MAKPALLDFSSATATEIVWAVMNGVTSYQNLRAFRSRAGGTAKADKLYPQTREAMLLINAEKKKARDRRAIKDLIRPFSQSYANGATLTEILSPVLKGYRQMYLDKLGLDLTHEQIIMLLIATDGVEQLEKSGYHVIGDFPTATAV
ncbi:hypothetical protein [Phytobacter diazotrophicus]|uniref:hypothetical protein n=1 Tax=Phytobacter diazotrophicus TaxID=395631 RepID=UPI002FF9771C|nr:hypothetical protein [Klebsiella variicola subsp. variicola]